MKNLLIFVALVAAAAVQAIPLDFAHAKAKAHARHHTKAQISYKCCQCNRAAPALPGGAAYCVVPSHKGHIFNKNSCVSACQLEGMDDKAGKEYPDKADDSLANACNDELQLPNIKLCSDIVKAEEIAAAKVALKAKLKQGTDYNNLVAEITKGLADEVVDAYVDGGLVTTATADNLALFFDLEVKLVREAKNFIDGLAVKAGNSQLSAKLVGADTEVKHHLNVGASASDKLEQTAKWICASSGTCKGNFDQPTGWAAIKTALDTLNPIQAPSQGEFTRIFNAIVPGGVGPFRPIAVQGGKLCSSPSGKALTAYVITKYDNTWSTKDKALFLLGALIRAHGFPDGNGRTCRAIFGLVMAADNAIDFDVPSAAFDNELNGLNA